MTLRDRSLSPVGRSSSSLRSSSSPKGSWLRQQQYQREIDSVRQEYEDRLKDATTHLTSTTKTLTMMTGKFNDVSIENDTLEASNLKLKDQLYECKLLLSSALTELQQIKTTTREEERLKEEIKYLRSQKQTMDALERETTTRVETLERECDLLTHEISIKSAEETVLKDKITQYASCVTYYQQLPVLFSSFSGKLTLDSQCITIRGFVDSIFERIGETLWQRVLRNQDIFNKRDMLISCLHKTMSGTTHLRHKVMFNSHKCIKMAFQYAADKHYSVKYVSHLTVRALLRIVYNFNNWCIINIGHVVLQHEQEDIEREFHILASTEPDILVTPVVEIETKYDSDSDDDSIFGLDDEFERRSQRKRPATGPHTNIDSSNIISGDSRLRQIPGRKACIV